MKQKITRQCFRFLMLFVGLFALSNIGWAYQDPRLVGDNFGGWSYKDNSSAKVISGSSITVDNWPGGYFKISAPYDGWDGEHGYSASSSSNTTLTNGTSANLTTSGYAMQLPASANGKSVTITLGKGSGNTPSSIKASWTESTPVTYRYYLHWWDSNGDGDFELTPGTTHTLTASTWKGRSFNVKVVPSTGNDLWYKGNKSAVTPNATTTFSLSTNGSDIGPLPNVVSGNYTVKLTINSSSMPSQLDVYCPAEKEELYYYTSDGKNNWTAGKMIEVGQSFTIISNGTSDDQAHYFVFGKTPNVSWNSSDLYAWGQERNVSSELNKNLEAYTGDSNTSAMNVRNGKYTITVVDFQPGTKVIYKITKDNISLPVYPNGIYSESELTNKASEVFPVYYLQSMVLNNNRITPEYQMQKQSDGTYTLEFTYRNTTTENENWSTSECYIWVEGYASLTSQSVQYGRQASNNLKDGKTMKEGRRYKAIFDPMKSGTAALTFEDLGVQMPFISMVGENWKQRVQADTPSPYGNKNTGSGWQEAWVQYNAKGQMARDRAGKVMYNTMWPPKHDISFQTIFTVNGTNYNFGLSTDQLMLSPVMLNGVQETKTGKEWKEDTRFAKYVESNNSHNPSSPAVKKGLCLNDSQEYTLYRVQNMWISGKVKIWTGWGGVTGTNTDANWSWHSNWGHFGQSTSATTISPQYSVPLSNQNGDVMFSQPTYFKYVDFFYSKTNPNDKGYSVLFTELAQGGAEIGAMNDETYSVGYYRPGLTDFAGITQNIKSIVIDCYEAGEEGEYMGNVIKLENQNITPSQFYAQFNNNASTSVGDTETTTSVSKAKYILYEDSRDFANGDYKYVMTVTLADGTVLDVVESNPFTIFNSQIKSSIVAYQLVSDKTSNSGDFVTFRGSNGVPTTPVYKVSKSGNAITYTALAEMPDYGDASKYAFTDQVLLLGSGHASADEVISYAFAENSATIPSGAQFTNIHNQSANGDRFAAIVTQDAIKSTSYALQMKYKMNFNAAGEATDQEFISTAGNTSIPLTVPQPKFVNAQVEVYYGSDNTEDTDDDVNNFKFKGAGGTDFILKDARYQNVREIVEVELPNVTNSLNGKMSDVFKYVFVDDKGRREDITRYIISDELGAKGTMQNKPVEPSTLFKNAEGGYDYKELKLETSGALVFDRGWKNGYITSIALSDNEPLYREDKAANSSIKVSNSTVEYKQVGDELHLIGNFDLYIQVDAQNSNDVDHDGKNIPNDDLLHGNTENGMYDYFYITVVDKTTGKDDESRDLVKTENNAVAEFIATVENLDKDHENGGMTVKIWKDYGWVDNNWASVEPIIKDFEKYRKNLQLRVSYLYPFYAENGNAVVQNGRARVASNLTGSVVKSIATVWNLDDEADMDEGVMTGVEGIGADSDASLKVGRGFIEVAGDNVEIYSASGMHIGTGAGRYDVAAGIYMVNLNGQIHKVLVK